MRRLATLSLLAFVAISFAQVGPPPMGGQGGGPGQGQGGSGMSRAAVRPATFEAQTETMRILSLTSVQNDLALTLAEWTALNKVSRSLKGASVTEDQALEAATKILTADQMTRLKELLVQDMGYGALALTDVRSRLALTTEQATQVETILGSLQTAKKALITGATAQKAVKELQSQANAQLAKLLTTEQDTKLRSFAGRALGASG